MSLVYANGPYPRGDIGNMFIGVGVGEMAPPDPAGRFSYAGPSHGRISYSVGAAPAMGKGDIMVARVVYETTYTTDLATFPVGLTGVSDDYGNSWSLAFSLNSGTWQMDTYWTQVSSPFPDLTDDYVDLSWLVWPQGLIFPEIPPLVAPDFNYVSPNALGFIGWTEWDSRFAAALETEVYAGGFTNPALVGVDPGGSWSGGAGVFGALGLTSTDGFEGVIWSALTDSAVNPVPGTYLPEAWTPNVPYSGDTPGDTVAINNSFSFQGVVTATLYGTNTVYGTASMIGGLLWPGAHTPVRRGPIHLDDVHFRPYQTDDTELVP